MKLWPHQLRGLRELWRLYEGGARRLCLTAPTGGGKSRMMAELIAHAHECGKKVCLYTNRILLTSQNSRVLDNQGVAHGIRAAGFDPALLQDVQVCSIATEYSRCIRRQQWQLHEADIVLVDEIHGQKAGMSIALFGRHLEHGATLMGFTATPLGIGHMFDHLVVAGTNSELRKCGALLPCTTFAPDEPDVSQIRRNKVGEYAYGDVAKVIHKQVLWGRVIDWYRKVNPFQRPSILFAPGVSESKWFADMFTRCGIRAAHIDGKHIFIDDEEHPSSQELREQVLQESQAGTVKVICNRFVLREGIDAPWLYHCIMATPFGSTTSYLQAGGRLLRNHHSIDHVVLQDHGGNVWRHGSLNDDREWDLKDDEFTYNPRRVAKRQQERVREPICCPACGGLRMTGVKCPYCGHHCGFRFRSVIQLDGTLKRVTAEQMRQRKQRYKHSENQRQWSNCFWALYKRNPDTTVRSVAGFHYRKYGSYPAASLKGVPQSPKEWSLTLGEWRKRM